MKNVFNRVYLIDDDPNFNFTTRVLLGKLSFAKEIIDYTDANVAINHLKIGAALGSAPLPDLIFLDLKMPGMDGWNFLDQYQIWRQTFLDDCKLYVLTSFMSDEDKLKLQSYSCISDFIIKPLAFEKIKIIQEGN